MLEVVFIISWIICGLYAFYLEAKEKNWTETEAVKATDELMACLFLGIISLCMIVNPIEKTEKKIAKAIAKLAHRNKERRRKK